MSEGPRTVEPSAGADAPDDYRDRIEHALTGLPTTANAARVRQVLGAAGVLAGLYRPASGSALVVDPGRLGALLGAVDARGDNGVTLGLLVQVASTTPLLGSGTPGPGGQHTADRSPVARLYERVLAGRATVALAATDRAAAGSDLTGLGTEVDIGDDEVVVRGSKRWITNLRDADEILVLARHRPGRHFTSFTWVLVPADAPGVTALPADTDLLDGAGIGHLELSDVRLPAARLVGRTGRGLAVFARHMCTERLAGAQWAVALTSRVVAETCARLRTRTVDGTPLWNNDAVRQDVAAALVRIAQLRALCDAWGERAAHHHAAAGSLLKSAAGLTSDAVLTRCAQLQGADGLAAGGAQRVRAEAGVIGIGGGATELMLGNVADDADQLLAELRS